MSNIVLYSTHCPKCIFLEKRLKSAGINFKSITDIQTMLNMGFKNAPMMTVDGKIMNFTEANNWIKASITTEKMEDGQ